MIKIIKLYFNLTLIKSNILLYLNLIYIYLFIMTYHFQSNRHRDLLQN